MLAYFVGTQFELEDDVTFSRSGYIAYTYHSSRTSQRVETQWTACCGTAYFRSGYGNSTGKISLRLVE